MFGYFQSAASSTTEKTAKTSSAMEDSGKGSERDEVEVVSPPSLGGPKVDDDSSTEAILSATTNSVLRAETSYPCTGLSPDVPEPRVRNYPVTLHSVASQRLPWETRVRAGRLSLHAVESTTAGAQARGCTTMVDQPGDTCDACCAVKFSRAYRGETG